MVDIKKYLEKDLYKLLGVNYDATAQEIRKAYRKKALKFHPDKNPDKSAEVNFLELSKALEVLTDHSAKSAYDKVLNARKAAELRNQRLDSKRQKLKADLEKREKAVANGISHNNKSDEQILKEEIERLRCEGSKLLIEEQELMKQELLRQQIYSQKPSNSVNFDSSQFRVKIKWDANHTTTYNEEKLRFYLKKYGEIVILVMSPKKKNSALVEFKTQEAAEMAVSYEKGLLENPLHLEWITPKGKPNQNESLISRQARQKEERARLIAEMARKDTFT